MEGAELRRNYPSLGKQKPKRACPEGIIDDKETHIMHNGGILNVAHDKQNGCLRTGKIEKC